MNRFARLLLAVLLAASSYSAQAARPDITVMGYNIMQLPVQDWDQTERANHLPAALRTLPSMPDVIGFSEVFTDHAYNTITGMYEFPYVTPVLGLVCSGGNWNSITGPCSNMIGVVRGGVSIASQHPILEQHALVFSNYVSGSWDAQANKGAVYAKIDIDGYLYHIVATHLQATHDETDDTEHTVRMAQLQEIHSWLDSFNIPSNEPVILAGDMNVPFSLGSQVNDMLANSQAAMNFPDNDGFGSYPENNWMSRAYNYYWGYDMCYDDTLDYVFHRTDHLQPIATPEMDVIALKSPSSWYWYYLYGNWPLCGGSSWHNGYTTDISDHYPVMATYQYNETPVTEVHEVTGSWTRSSGKSSTGSGNPHFSLTLTQAATVTIDLLSSVDNYLYALDSTGTVLAQDNDSGAGNNARITISLAAGSYELVAATNRNRQSGSFTLTVSHGHLSP